MMKKGPQSKLIGLVTDHSPDLLVGLFGILKSGNGFVPITPSTPNERIGLIINDCRIEILVTESRYLDKILAVSKDSPGLRHVICVDAVENKESLSDGVTVHDCADFISRDPVDTGIGPTPDEVLYVIFTSGSTGTPKGVPITHRNLAPLLHWSEKYFKLDERTRVLQNLSYGFDFGVFELLTTALFGGTLYFTDREDMGDLPRYGGYIEKHEINTIHTTPSSFREMTHAADRLGFLKKIHFGGEELTKDFVDEISRVADGRCAIYNGYGPTEASINCTIFEVGDEAAANHQSLSSIPIGKATPNSSLFVLDKHYQPVPIGVPGELHVGGPGLASGYLNRPELTAEKFLPDPFSNRGGGRLYKTGDIVRYLPDGNIVFMGRIDHQIKVRGFRIELGEIEAALRRHPSINETVVIAREDERGNKSLVAYVTIDGAQPSVGQLRAFLKQRLPEYMVPSSIVTLDGMPVTPSGKVDRRALPAPEISRRDPEETFVAPRTPEEETIASICADLLGLESLGVHDDFFNLGCHSLMATRIIARLREAFQIELPLIALFENPSVARLAAEVDHALRSAQQLEISPIRPVPRDRDFPLSFAQERLWFLCHLDPNNTSYYIPRALRITGPFDVDVLERTFTELVRRHEILRTTFPLVDGRPVQLIHPPEPFVVSRIDLREVSEDERESQVEQIILAQGQRPFDLEKDVMLRVVVVRLAELEYVMVLTEHHLVHDGWTQGVLVRDFLEVYAAFASGKPSPSLEPALQYADFAYWQRSWLKGEVLETQLSYWSRQLAGAPLFLELPADRPRPPAQSFKGAEQTLIIDREFAESLRGVSRQQGVTLFMTMFAAFNTLLYRYTSREDILVGSGIANRRWSEIEGLLGMIINTLVLRTDLSGSPTFRELLQRVRAVCLQAYAHQDTPFEKVVEELKPDRSLSYNPVFQVMFSFMDAPTRELELPGLTMSVINAHNRSAKFDLNVVVIPHMEQLIGQAAGAEHSEITVLWEYSTDIFDHPTIARMLSHFENILRAAVTNPAQRISELPILTGAERRRLLLEWNDANVAYPQNECIHRLFELQVERLPNSVAVTSEDSLLTYLDLNRRANQLAHYLLGLGVGRERPTAICLDRSADIVVAILAVLKAGGAYLPLDPAYPQERLIFMLEDSRAPVLLTERAVLDRIPEHSSRVICLDADWEKISAESDGNPNNMVSPDDAAYIIYTSGSTGKPKGVLITHYNVTRLFEATQPWFNFDERDTWTMFHSYSFDFSVWEAWGALLHGGRLVVVPYLVSRSPEAFYDLLCGEHVTVLNQTPSAFRQLILAEGSAGKADSLALRLVIFGGEALDLQSLRPWFERHGDERPQLVNMYGITETTVHVTYRPLSVEDTERPSGSVIGRAIPDLQIYILDQNLEPAPPGVPGEIYVGGAGVARGYLNRPELNAERFIANPFSKKPGERLYRSGDMARYLGDGDIEYVGRIDQQVKIRGFRIELGEIEASLYAHAAVREAVVMIREDAPGEKRLAAYIVDDREQATTIDELRDYLKQKLPEYMMPASFVLMDALPLTTHGKVDRRALPGFSSSRPESGKNVAPPVTLEEEVLADVWAEVLGIERVGVQDNFFDLGGDSILSIQVVTLARKRGLSLALDQLFRHQTIQELARGLVTDQRDLSAFEQSPAFDLVSPDDRPGLPEGIVDAYPLTELQAGMFFHSAYRPESALYHNIASFHLKAPLDVDKLETALRELADCHPVLRTAFDLTSFSEPLQLVYRSVDVPLQVDDLRHLNTEQQERVIADWFEDEKSKKFDWGRAPLLRLHIHRRGEETFQFSLTEHHAILDGWSVASMLTELFRLYLSLPGADAATRLRRPAAAFANYAALERRALQSQADRSFWARKLSDCMMTKLPRRHSPRQVSEGHSLRRQEVPISIELSKGLKRTARLAEVPLKSVLLAAHLRVLSLLAGHSDVMTGLTSNGRPEAPDAERALGLFLNTLPFRLDVRGGNWVELARKTFKSEQELLPFRRFPLAEIQRLMGGKPLVETAFNFVHFHVARGLRELENLQVLGVKTFAETNFTLMVHFSQDISSSEINLRLDYNALELDPEQAANFAHYYSRALQAMASEPLSRCDSISLMPEEERAQLLVEWNNTARDYPGVETINQLFEARAEASPNAIAIIFEENRLTYRELNQRSNQVARFLKALGIGPESRVSICAERSLEMVVGMLGILKSGGAYVPLDPAYPKDRIEFMLEDSRTSVLLTQERLLETLPQRAARTVCLDRDWGEISQESDENCDGGAEADNLAYVIYTSGSTGKPKGTGIQHHSAVTLLNWAGESFSAEDFAGTLASTSICFDLSVFELFAPLSAGGTIILARDALELSSLRAANEVTLINTVPSAAAEILRGEFLPASARIINLAGEPVQRSLVKRIYECNHIERIYNLYGPSEDTTYSTFSLISRDGNEAPAIGRPIANTQVYILDAQLQPVPLSVIGEIYIGGDGVARGYLGRPDLTAEKFLPNPFGDKRGDRLYKTGDLARYLPDGNIEFQGRIDYQVKLRGFRIELGEIEAALNEYPGVRESVIVPREDVPGDTRLVAYLVAQEDHHPVAGALREYLREKLPDYMVPSAFVLLQALPLTPNGKLDRRALPAADLSSFDRPSGFAAPSSLIERTIASVWQQVLHLDNLSIHDNFFDLGGHSLLLVRVHNKLRNLLNADLSIVDLFHYPSIKLLADHLSASQDGRASGAASQSARSLKAGSEPLAIIAMAGRFPGAQSVEQFWRNLSSSVESVKHFSEEELIEAGLDASVISDPDYVKAAGVLDEVEMFDASFFGLTPREAEITDPQHRLFLECAWEALERAGYEAEQAQKLIGVYSGVGLSSYLLSNLLADEELMESVGRFQMMLSNDRDFLPTRVSYKLNLKGPSLNVQTACSTSLVAVHLACKGLQNGECDLAIAGGVTIRVPQQRGYRYQQGGINSSDGHCRAFDAKATGTVFGSGIGIVVLKRLAEAIEEGDNIIAVIRGSAINNDGSVKVGYTAPGLEGQAAVISEALKRAEVRPEQISYVEAHGTATALGDPIEVAALAEVYAGASQAKQWCAIGSVKTNVGHLDAAAGVAGLIKVALALKHRQVPASLHFGQANPEIDFANSPFYVNAELRKWERRGGPLRAAVSSFGIGGTNAHVILEEAPQLPPPDEGRKWQLMIVSARTQQGLEAARLRLGDHLESTEEAGLADVAYTLAVGRKQFSHRAAVVCSSKEEAIAGLRAGTGRSVIRGSSDEAGREVIMMFSGQGTQYAQMGAGLYKNYKVFREALDNCSEMAEQELGLSIREVIFEQGRHGEDGAKLLEQTSVTQAALFAVEYAGVKLWESLGVRATAMMGHSIGEYVAATVAGVMSLEEAVRLVSVRGKLMQEQERGAMLAVTMSEEEMKRRMPEGISIAAVNESRQVVVGGREQDVERMKEELRREGIQSRRLKTSHAFHSWMMKSAAREMEREVRKAKLMEPKVRYISGVTGGWIKGEEAVSAEYWGRQMMEPVRWWEGVKELLKIEGGVMLEVGPGGSLTSMVRREAGAGRVIESTIRREDEEKDDEEKLMEAAGRMWVAGVKVEWRGMYEGEKRRRVELPTYPFERRRFWIEPQNRSYAGAGLRALPGKRLDVADWLHMPYWKPSVPIAAAPFDLPIRKLRWLVFMDGQGLGASLVERLKPHAESIVIVRAGEGFTNPGDDEYTINPLRRDDFYTLIEHLRAPGKIPGKIVHLWSLLPGNEPPLDLSRSDKPQSERFYSLLFLAQALGKKNITDLLEIDVVTRNAQGVTGEEIPCCEEAMVSALCRVIPQEYSNITCRNIDVTTAESGSWQERKLTDRLLAELVAEPTDPVVVHCGNTRWVSAYEPVRASENGNGMMRLRQGGVYWITGGLGKIGLVLAEFLAESVRAKLILSGRSGLPGYDDRGALSRKIMRKIMKVRGLEKLGAEVLVVSADVASEEQMRETVNQAIKRFGKIDGVIHAAGIASSFRTIQELEESECDSIFHPKIEGVRVLEKVLEGMELDFCFLMTSLSAILGGLGMAAYSSANGYMSAFARRHNRTSPVPWTCISWDGWQSVGESTPGGGLGAAIAQPAITPKEGVETFKRALSLGAIDEVVVSTTDLQARLDQWVKPGSLRYSKQESGAAPSAMRARPDLPDSLDAPRNRIEQIVLGLWKELLGVESIGIHDDFFELGGQSLLATQLISRARAAFGVDLPLRAFFATPTIAGLSGKIGEAIIHLESASGSGAAERLEGLKEPPSSESAYTIARRPRQDSYPLSFAQQRLWFVGQLAPDSPLYNLTVALQIMGPLDAGALEQSLSEVVRRHEALRTKIVVSEGQPSQVVCEAEPLKLSMFDLSGLSLEERDAEARQIIKAQAEQPFDLSRGSLLRAELIKLSERHHLIALTIHHIVSDGWSMGILVREVGALYEAYSTGSPSPLPELPIQYADFAVWQRDWLRGEILEEHLPYWQEQLRGTVQLLDLPTVRSRPSAQSYRGGRVPLLIGKSETEALKGLARRNNATLFMTLLAAFNTLLYRYTGQEDILVGSPVANRNRKEIENLIGLFLNTLVMRTDLSGDPNFEELLEREKEVALSAFAHQDVPFERLVEMLRPERGKINAPLLQVMFVMQNAPMPALVLSDLTISPIRTEAVAAEFDITLSLTEKNEELLGVFDYSTDLFDEPTIRRMAGCFHVLLDAIATQAAQPVSSLPLLSEAERSEILNDWNDTAAACPQELCIHRLFEAQVERSPGAIAVVCERQQLSYAELNYRANGLANHLLELGVGPDARVGVCVEQSLDMIVALLAVLKAGGAYVPLDSEYPGERLAFMMADAGVKVLLTQRRLTDAFAESGTPVVCLDGGGETLRRSGGRNPASNADSGNLAYVIYTSGSTGQAKGVMVPHRGVVNTLSWRINTYSLTEADRVLQNIPFTFDPSVWQIFGALLSGATLILPRPGGHKDVDYLIKLMAEQEVSIADFPPSVLRILLDEEGLNECKNLRYVFSGGEALAADVQERFIAASRAQLCNQYGPTETTIDATYWECQRSGDRRLVPIGRPISNTQVYLLDHRLEPVPVGITGELYIGGAGVSRGYLGMPDLTAEKFIPNPLTDEAGARLYKTGDLARYLETGVIEFLGRIDYQVKVRGIRIEVGEVETALRECPGVTDAIIVAREDGQGDKQLVAYVAADWQSPLTAFELRSHLRSRLPNFMLPSHFVILEKLPYTSTGKIDRQALPAPAPTRAGQEVPYVPARTPIEEALIQIWEELLKLERIGVQDNFFNAGGHSLMSMQLLSQVRKKFGVDLPLRNFFEWPTVEGLAKEVEEALLAKSSLASVDELLDMLEGFKEGDIYT